MERINTTHPSETIEWDPFLQFFCRRGRLRDSEQLLFQYKDLNISQSEIEDRTTRYDFLEEDDDDLEVKKERLRKDLSTKLCYKQNMVPKQGKGKYDVTVPVLFEFQKNPNERKSTRQLWLEEEVARKERQL